MATGEHNPMKSEINLRRKGDLRSRRSTAKLLGKTSAMNELWGGRIECGSERVRTDGENERGKDRQWLYRVSGGGRKGNRHGVNQPDITAGLNACP